MDLLARQTADFLERKRAEEIEKTLIREVQHRSNNLLAVIQSIAHRSLSGDYPLALAKQAFEARLQALARANRQLTQSNWCGVNLNEIVRLELEPFADRTIVEGVNVTLGPHYAQNFCLALHELATNAAKYGALSNRHGRVEVSWTIATGPNNDRLKFKWRERGGPAIVAPTRRGFGTSLLKAAFEDVRFDYASEGLDCEIDLLLPQNQPDVAPSSDP
jgi:two-component sensor histidine kinase